MADNKIANAIKFLKGEEKSLPATKTEGQVYFAYKDVGTAEKPSYTGAIYIDTPIGGTQTRIKMTANADIAEYAKKANTDSQGNLITGYLRNASLTGNADSQTFTFTAPSGAKFNLKLNGVNDSQAGLVTSGDQTFPGYKTLKLRAKPSSIIGSDAENSDGWYKVATSTMSGYDNTNILYYVKNGYSPEAVGILDFEMRSSDTSIQCWACKWLVRGAGFTSSMFRVVIDGMTWTLYAYQPVKRWGRISITEISNTNMSGDNPNYKITYYNSTTKETTEPDKTISSSDGGQVYLASKATNDGNGQNIANTYIKSLSYSNDGKQLIATRGSGDTSLKLSLPIASTTKSGIVTTDAQSFGGTKTFTTINSTNLTVTGSSGFNYSGIEIATGNKARPVWFAYDGINGKPVVNANFTYNPATQTLSVANLSGTADKAIKDDGGQNIRSTYIKNITVNGTTLTITKGGGATSDITLQDTNNKVTQTAIKSSDYTNWRTVLWGASNSATEGFTPTTVTDSTFTSDTLTFQPSSGTLKAKIFKGSLSGNASTATSATKATYDSSGTKDIRSYVSDITISGRTVTVTKGSGAQVTFTTQDTNTWRGIQNNLTSDSITDSLSAAQGKYLKSLIDGKSNKGHNHDERYYTETEIDNKLKTYLSLTGGTLTGLTRFQAGTDVWNAIGTAGTAGYIKIAIIEVKSSYANAPIEIAFSRRNDTSITRITIAFNPSDSIDPTLKTFTVAGSTRECWLAKSATSTWDLYIKKTERYDNIGITSFYTSNYSRSNISVTWSDTQAIAIPEGATQASYGWYVYHANLADTATNATNANKATNDSGGQNIRSTYISNVEADKDNKYKYNFKTPTGAIRNSITIYDEFQKRSQVDATTDWNTLTSTGIYKVQMSAWGDATKMHSPNSYNKDLYSFGILLVFESIANDSEKRFTQIYIPHNDSVGISGSAYKRMHNGNDITTSWQSWHPIARGLNWSELTGKPNYAGSSSAGGAATSANKLNTNAGSAALPVYFSNGIPVACSTNLGVSITGNAASATKLTSNAGSTIQPIYFKDGKPIATTYSLNATVKAGISNRIAFYSGNNEISSASSLKYYTATNSKKANQTILRIWGTTYGNDAATMISGKASSLSWNDGGPQIQFSTSEVGSQDGALIFTDHDSAGIGASFHFVSNQSEWSVVSKRFVAKTSVIIGQENHTTDNQGYNLYVNGTEYINGILTAVGDCAFIARGNEFNFVPTLKATSSVWFNYRQTGGQPTAGDFIINEYVFGNGANKALASIKEGLFSGAATYVRDSNNKTNNISITYSKAEQASTSWLASWNGYELGRISPANITAGKATKLATARTITLSGAVTGSVSFDGSTNVTLTTSVNHTHSQYYDSNVSRTKNTVLAAPNGADGKAVFRSLVAADIPTLTKSKISDFPTSLKNPNALTITLNGGATEGTNKFTYDGSVAKTINITPSGIGAATSGHTHNYAGSSSAGGSANSAIKLATARKISLKGLSQGSANFDGSGDITIEDTGYGCKKYVTQNAITEPYFRIAYFSTKNTYVDASMIFVIDSGFKGGGYGIVKVAFRSDNCVDKDKSSCEVLWLVRQGFEANQLFVKGYAPAGGTQYVDLYFKATGTYQAVTIRVLSSGGRGSQNRNWTFEESAPLAAATIRAYSYTTEGFDAGTANLSHFATKLQTPRIINGTSFNGGADITTAKWGTARNIYIRDCNSTNTGTAVSVNGSDNAYLLMPSTARFTGSVGIGNGSGATLNFYTAANTIGAKIVAYNDRIEFVFA